MRFLWVGAMMGLAVAGVVRAQRAEPIAETKLIMEGLAQANFRGLERLLTQKPADADTWVYARGQALLLAETSNLLVLRPPKNAAAQTVWLERTAEFRQRSTELARELAAKDYPKSRAAFVNVANSCNRCHQSFRVSVEITPFAAKPAGPACDRVSIKDRHARGE